MAWNTSQHEQGEDHQSPNAVGQHAVDTVAGRELEAARLGRRPRPAWRGPSGSGPRSRPPARSRPAPASRRAGFAQSPLGLVVVREQRPLEIAVGVQQQPAHQASGAGGRPSRPPAARPPGGRLPARRPRGRGCVRRGRTGRGQSPGVRGALDRFHQRRLEFIEADAMVGLRGHDRHGQTLLEPGKVDGDAAAGRHVDHVDGHDGGQPQFQDLAEEVEIALGGWRHRPGRRPRPRRPFFAPPQEDVDRHHFVAGPRGEAVEPRQVDHLEAAALVLQAAELLLDGHARIVAHVLMDADQGAEERRFARVRVSDQGDSEGGGPLGHGSIGPGDGKDEHVEQLAGTEADLIAGHAEDAGGAGAKHLDLHAVAQSEFLQAMDVVGASDDAADAGPLAGFEEVDGDGGGGEGGALHPSGWHVYLPVDGCGMD